MKRTTVFLPEPLHDELRHAAFQARVSMAELIRIRLQRTSRGKGSGQSRRPRRDPLLDAAGSCGLPPFSAGIDAELYGG